MKPFYKTDSNKSQAYHDSIALFHAPQVAMELNISFKMVIMMVEKVELNNSKNEEAYNDQLYLSNMWLCSCR